MQISSFLSRASIMALATAAAVPAFAQSTATQDFENQSIVVTGTRGDKGIEGVQVPKTSKSREVFTQDYIKNQVPGQSVDQIINMMPGVNFSNNDPYGASGGNLVIRGFDASRISQTFDGIPLNDTGNYAIYSQQQLDSELIQQVNVNLGTTDVDSPTAGATGSTVNYTTRNPTEDFHAQLVGSFGQWDYFRVFGVVDTGNFTPFNTRAFIAASHSENVNPFNDHSKTDRFQVNTKIYQPIGSSGDFISIAGHYNWGRNQNFSSMPLREDTTQNPLSTAPRVVGTASANRLPLTRSERNYTPANCTTAAARPGVADTPNSCGTLFDYSYNPSNTGNIRVASRFTLADGLVLTVEPSYQIVKANGGLGAIKGNEGNYARSGALSNIYGYIGGQPYFGGVDLNGDGDILDTYASTATGRGVELYAPSETKTKRWVVLSSLRYDINDTNTVRVSYTFDHGRHRQTGEVTTLGMDGYSNSYFPEDNALLDRSGKPIEKRNRLSYAILQQVSGEYRGNFFDKKLSVNLGVRAPFFTRKLNNFCVTEAGGTFVDCFNDPVSQATFLAANPTYAAPQSRNFHYNKVLPNAGLTWNFTNKISAYANYSKGLQVPATDNLYQSFAFSRDSVSAKPAPETTDNFDLGARYSSSKVQAQIAGWYTIYHNRLASSYDRDLDITLYRNLGKVDRYGIDANVSYSPIRQLTGYVFGSWLKSKILDDVQSGATAFAATKGKRESAVPTYSFGGRLQGNFEGFQLGIQAKRTGPRYVNDQNLPISASYCSNGVSGACTAAALTGGARTLSYQIYGAKTPAYTTVDLDARISGTTLGMTDRLFVQLNVTNLFDKLYVGGFTGNLSNASIPNVYVGAPRTVSGTIGIGF